MATPKKTAAKPLAGSKKSIVSKSTPASVVAEADIDAEIAATDMAADKPDDETPTVRRKEMVDRIVASTGKKPNEIKSVLDGVLEEIGNALSAGESLNLHPLGKVSVNRQKIFDDREVLICKIRRKIEPVSGEEPFETAAE